VTRDARVARRFVLIEARVIEVAFAPSVERRQGCPACIGTIRSEDFK
jgi:hypothetical protein